jgi:predicted RNase H-like HicB family nuclease
MQRFNLERRAAGLQEGPIVQQFVVMNLGPGLDQALLRVGSIRLLGGRPEWYSTSVIFSIEIEREADGRWIAEVPDLSGVMCYGADRDEAIARVQALALRVIAERLEHREAPAEFLNVAFRAA